MVYIIIGLFQFLTNDILLECEIMAKKVIQYHSLNSLTNEKKQKLKQKVRAREQLQL